MKRGCTWSAVAVVLASARRRNGRDLPFTVEVAAEGLSEAGLFLLLRRRLRFR